MHKKKQKKVLKKNYFWRFITTKLKLYGLKLQIGIFLQYDP